MGTPVPSTRAEDYQDRDLNCEMPRCFRAFTWTAGEQAFIAQLYAAGKIQEITKPKRCPACRAEKRRYFAAKEANDNTYGIRD